MNRQIEIIPTVVPDSLDDIVRVTQKFLRVAPAIHIDAGDGIFVQNRTWMPGPNEKIPDARATFFEAHLMIEEPRLEGIAFIDAGCKRISAHIEAFPTMDEAHGALDAWKKRGAEAGLAILLDTPIEVLEPLILACDVVLVMSIGMLGKQGAAYDPRAVDRIAQLRQKFPELLIAVDGGVNETNILELVEAGATRFSVGSAISKAPEPIQAYQHLVDLVKK